MITNLNNTKYTTKISSRFKKDYKKIVKQQKDTKKLIYVLKKLANGEELDYRFFNHKLKDNKYYQNCYECHIEPDWLLVYKYEDDVLVLIIVATGSHSELFGK